LFISHDRDFIDALATRVVEVLAGALHSYPGNYSEYRQSVDRGAQPAAARTDPAAVVAPPADAKRDRIAAREREKERARQLERARKRLAALEEDILADEERIEDLTRELAEPDVYSDGDFVRATLAERDGVRASIEARYADWEAIAAEIESLERAAAR
jgi:ATPase subunit of ABC transporter with duplicated ATPase domains